MLVSGTARNRCLLEPDTWWDEYQTSYAGRSWREARPLLSAVVTHGFSDPLLDVGAGCGFLIECARRFGITAIGVEGSTKAIDICREKHPLADMRLWHGGTDLPVDSTSIGVVVANEFIDHITMEQDRVLFKEVHRVLKPDGVLIVNSPSRHNRYDQDLGHVSFFRPLSLPLSFARFRSGSSISHTLRSRCSGTLVSGALRCIWQPAFTGPKGGRRESTSLL